jgi:DUF1707 SHOCT-like domain
VEPYARMRASDQDRNEAVLALGEHHASGRITLPEFTERMEQALACTYLDELDPLFADLPVIRAATVVAARPVPAAGHGLPPVPAAGRGLPPVALVAVPLLIALAVLVVGAGFLFPFWLPLALFWIMGGSHRHWRIQHSTVCGPQGRRHRRW